jgi:hypothetical protein
MIDESVSGVSFRQGLDGVAAALERQLRGRIDGLRLRVDDGAIVIEGRAESYYVKQLAQHAVMQATPSTAVDNAIVVS